MRYYVEGSPTGPESFAKEDEAREWAQVAADRFRVRTEVYTSDTHEPLRGNGHYGSPTGAPFATFMPRPKQPTEMHPEPGDVIACVLAGDDEVTDENVATADQILEALRASGFTVTETGDPVIDLNDPQVRADIIEALDRAGEDLAYARDGGNYEDPDIAGVNAQIDRWSKLWKRLVAPVG
jgi:hypothetical protein